MQKPIVLAAYVVAVGIASGVSAPAAFAQPSASSIAGTYMVKYEEVSNNCNSPLMYPTGKMVLKAGKGSAVTIDIDRTPVMTGSAGKNGKVSAKSLQKPTMIEGMNGVFSIAGKIAPDGMLSLVMVGEYSTKGRALCTQSWNVVGAKTDDPAPKKTK